ncbi:uncharacterized protein A4U43_C08F33740 [Asparagus officinalis]|uniref:uncharacterized protein LOC109820710 n=1 Tax=Asparagus officinalis TaxID=4686 RepID=UPI00098E6F64|nr:uncharacterized protein LOC109820710 [Asparagus officinalis]ONK61803.1 uncharacterized protein A4U43_C08F33740 [Asparagus officinalis]
MENRCGSSVSGSRIKRKPFSDLTNSPSPLVRSKPKPKPRPKPGPKPKDAEPAFSSTANEEENRGDLQSSAASTCGKDVDNNENSNNSRPIKVRRKDKEIAFKATSTLSCPPPERNRSIEHTKLKNHIGALHKAFSAPRERTQKRKHQHGSSPVKLQKSVFPPDFVEKQRAYFAEIDAFELPEEEVSDGGLE